MEERLRVMRQVSRYDIFVCIFIFVTAFVFIFDWGTSSSDVPGLYVMECTEGKVGDTMSPFSLQLPHSAIPLQQHWSVPLQIWFFVRLQIFSKGLPTSSRAGRLRRKKLTLKLKPYSKQMWSFVPYETCWIKAQQAHGLTTFALTTDRNKHTVLLGAIGATRATSMKLFNMCKIGHDHSTASIRIEIVCLQYLVLGFALSWWVYVIKPKKCSRIRVSFWGV